MEWVLMFGIISAWIYFIWNGLGDINENHTD